ncbi:protein GVQW3-like [Sphaeramia orbicularis]|uniref:protein GVQW3-like n=1 Tax=Sphaeramia orbicularis TaxID=375764 RepID=UPI00117C1411|nr:protein GVQW3-like [Sphaeramia orbicularis]
MERRINLRFLVKLGRSPTECLKLLREAYGEDAMSQPQVFEGHKCFKRGREEVDDDPKSGRPSMTKTDENSERVKKLVRSDRRLTVRMMAEQLSLNRESLHTILKEELGMRKVCAKMVPKDDFCDLLGLTSVPYFPWGSWVLWAGRRGGIRGDAGVWGRARLQQRQQRCEPVSPERSARYAMAD